MNAPSREEFEARIEAVEARMDTRMAQTFSKIDVFVAQQQARDEERDRHLLERDKLIDERLTERDKRLDERLHERDRLLDERDKRLELMAESARRSAEKTEGLKSTVWISSMSMLVGISLAVTGTVIASYHANQASILTIVQSTLAAVQQGQNMALKG